LARRCGADDAGLVEISRPALSDQLSYIRQVYPEAKAIMALCIRMNREPVRSPVRSVANQEFHAVYDEVNETARAIVTALAEAGIPACNAVAAFPMEVQLPGRGWMVAHKPVAVAAGLGHMGVHRSVIHPTFGSFVLLGSVLIGAEADAYDQPIEYNPCLECKLCVAACPVGALKLDGAFDFLTCYTHNYREFLGNFSDFVSAAVESKDMASFNERFSPGETTSMWQSLSFKPGYKAAYCISVCPAGEDVIGPFLQDQRAFVQDIVKPLQNKRETLYVIAESDAEAHAQARYPHKTLKRVHPPGRVASIAAFVAQLPLGFQRGRSKGLSVAYHWSFCGQELTEITVRIHEQRLSVQQGHVGEAHVTVTVGADTWLRIMNREQTLPAALARNELQIAGDRALFDAFGRCFPR
jgi:ferredoxin